MKKKIPFKKWPCTLGILICLFFYFSSYAHTSRPNIILILGDDVGYEIPTCNGGTSYTTPDLDKMASNGIRFTQFHASPLCSPSRFMLLTGKYNFRNYTNWGKLDTTQKTIGNMFRDAGYATACFGKWQLSGGDQSIKTFGFDHYCVWNPDGADDKGNRYKNPAIYANGSFVPDSLTLNKYGEDIFADSVINFIDRNKTKPFFIYYPMVLCHTPFSPTPDNPEYAAWNPNNPDDKSFFPSMVKYMDKKIGQVIDKVKSLGIEDNTVIIYVGDNGTTVDISSGFNGGQISGGKGATTENGTHTPLIIYGPGLIQSATVNDDLIDFTDFMPTLADMAGIAKPTTYGVLDGISFNERLKGNPGTPRDWIYCYYSPDHNNTPTNAWVQNKIYKLYDTSSTKTSFEFYNILNDVSEKSTIITLDENTRKIRQQFSDVINNIRNPHIPAPAKPVVFDITNFTARILSSIKSDSAATITGKWIMMSTSKDSLLQLKGIRIYSGSGISDYTNFVTGLKNNTTYYISDYGTNRIGSNQSEIASFTTVSGDDIFIPVLVPNPSHTYFTLSIKTLDTKPVNLKIFDTRGRIIYNTSGSPYTNYVFGNDFSKGIYLLEIIQSGKSKTLKIIKE